MSNKITIASAALLTAALLGFAAPTANAQLFGGLQLNTRDFSISLGTGHTCRHAPLYRYETVRRKVWRPATWRVEHVPAVYRTEYDCYGYATQVLVRAAYDRRIRVAGYWDFVNERVRVRQPCNQCNRARTVKSFHRNNRRWNRGRDRCDDRRDNRRNSRRRGCR